MRSTSVYQREVCVIFLGGKRRFEVVSDVCCRTNRDFCFGVVQAKLLARRRYDAAGRAGEYEHDASGELPHYVLLGEHVCRSQCAWKSDRCELQINLVALDDSDRMETDILGGTRESKDSTEDLGAVHRRGARDGVCTPRGVCAPQTLISSVVSAAAPAGMVALSATLLAQALIANASKCSPMPQPPRGTLCEAATSASSGSSDTSSGRPRAAA